MVDEHPTRQEMEDDMFEFDSNVTPVASNKMPMITTMGGAVDRLKVQHSQKVEEVKGPIDNIGSKGRSFSRSNTGLLATAG